MWKLSEMSSFIYRDLLSPSCFRRSSFRKPLHFARPSYNVLSSSTVSRLMFCMVGTLLINRQFKLHVFTGSCWFDRGSSARLVDRPRRSSCFCSERSHFPQKTSQARSNDILNRVFLSELNSFYVNLLNSYFRRFYFVLWEWRWIEWSRRSQTNLQRPYKTRI